MKLEENRFLTLPHDVVGKVVEKLSFNDTVRFAAVNTESRRACLDVGLLRRRYPAAYEHPAALDPHAALRQARRSELWSIANRRQGQGELRPPRPEDWVLGGWSSEAAYQSAPRTNARHSPDLAYTAATTWFPPQLWLEVAGRREFISVPTITYDWAFSPNSKVLAYCTGGGEGILRTYDLQTHQSRDIANPPTPWLSHCTFSNDGQYLAAASGHKTTWLWHCNEPNARLAVDGAGGPLTFSPNDALLLCGESVIDFTSIAPLKREQANT